MKRAVRALTLIEIIVMIVVIAILIGVLLPQFHGTQDETATQRARSELRTIATAIESYYIHNGNTLPTTLSTLMSATPRIMTTVPDDPFHSGSNDYTLYKDTNGVYYVVFSYGPDRTAGITGISTAGALTGAVGDDICVTNGTSAGGTSTC